LVLMTLEVVAPLLDQLRRTLGALTRPGERLLVAVSGGSDSVALLGLLNKLSPERLVVAHVNHGLRPRADRDAHFVVGLARELGLPCRSLSAPPEGADRGASETAARRRRLDSLGVAAQQAGCPWVLCAHHGDDAAETQVLHLARGHRGLRALAGIPSVRPLAPRVALLRPLLAGPSAPGRQDLQRARQALGLDCVQDETNFDRSVPRNAVRAWLEEGRPPLSSSHLARVRRGACRQLEATLARAASLLESELSPLGSGSLLSAHGLRELLTDDSLATEGLRLLGPCLRRPRRLTLRHTLLRRLREAAVHARGQLLLPANPHPLRARLGPEGLHFSDEALLDASPTARVLNALAQTPLHL